MHPAVIVFGLCVVACVVGHVAILRSVVRSRNVAGDAGVPRPKLIVEVLWALVPAIALAFVLTATWTHVRDRASTPREIMKVAR